MLFFSIAEVDGHVANDVKAMLVHSVKPVFNEMVEVNADLIVESRGSCDLVPNVIKHPKSK